MNRAAIVVRDALSSEVSLILRFIRRKATFDGVPDWVEATEQSLTAQLFGDRPAAHVLFGELDGTVVSFAIYFLTFSSFLGRVGIWLDDLYVDDNARGRGVGGALLRHLAKVATERGYGRIEWVTAGENARGLDFYRRNGAVVQDGVRVLRLDRSELGRLAEHGLHNT
jgi:GNAT superfamily N-acetyltransferase